MRPDAARPAFLGALFAALVTLPGLGTGTLWDNSETAYGEVAREIGLTHDWVVMHLNGAPWFVQPPLYFWLAAVSAKLFGLAPFALRLPSALATVAMSGLLGYAVARRVGARAGTLAAAVLATSLLQAIVGRLAIMDALLDLCVTAAILWWAAALEPGERSTGRRDAAFVLGALALALGTLAKGPVAPVIVVLIVGAWAWWERRAGERVVLPGPGAWAGAAAVYLAIVLPWFAALAVRTGPAALGELIGHYTFGRYTGVIENQRGPWFYYLPVIVLGFFPWVAFLPVSLAEAFHRARDRGAALERLALVWAILPVVFFSFAQTKLPNYIALIMPALAILVACWLDRAAERGFGRDAAVSAASIPAFVALLAAAIVLFSRSNALDIEPVRGQLAALGVGMLAGSLLTVAMLASRRTMAAAPYALGATSVALVLFIALVAEPAVEPLKPIPQIAHLIAAQRAPRAIVAIRTIGGTNGLAYYTSPGVVTIDDTDPSYLALVCGSSDVYVVTRAADAPRLESLARLRGRRASNLGPVRRVTAVHIDGPACSSRG
jgi:4-amino-4-deoxy-L-arabinose transferase-like glycosyltransferase